MRNCDIFWMAPDRSLIINLSRVYAVEMETEEYKVWMRDRQYPLRIRLLDYAESFIDALMDYSSACHRTLPFGHEVPHD